MTSQRHRKRILIVEDDPAIQLLLRHLLRPWFDLDLAVTVDEALNNVKQNPQAMNNQPERARILIVEDNPPIRLLFSHLLSPHFDLKLVDTVEGALEVATQEHFDLFLLDINLGEDRTGVDLLSLLRRMPTYDATPAVACTAYAGEDYREHFLACGFNEYVDKPFLRPILIGAIDQALDEARSWE